MEGIAEHRSPFFHLNADLHWSKQNRCFDEEQPMISGVALMTNTDDTGESVTAYYGDIIFKKQISTFLPTKVLVRCRLVQDADFRQI